MISDELKAIIESLRSREGMRFLEAATEEQITGFEKEEGIQLPGKYKEWLLFSDGGEFYLPGGLQIYGVAHKPIIDVSDDDKPGDQYTVIGALSFGDPILCEKGSETISIYNHEAGRIESDETYADFFCFLRDLPGIIG